MFYLVFRDFFTDSKFHNLDKFVEMFNNHVNYINDIFPEENQLEFGNESVVKLFSILNSYANLFKEKKWKVFSQELKVGGKIGNLGTNEGRFAGTIDMVVENEIGELFLIDLKTSTLDRTKFKYENTLGESEDTFLYAEKDKIQLNTYAYLMNQLAPNTNIQGLYILPIQISADPKTKNSKFSDASNISDFNEEIPLLEVEFEKDSYENVLGIKAEDLNIKKPQKRTGKFDISKGNVKNESFEGVEMEAFEMGSFLDQFETKPQSKKEEIKTKENKFNIQDIISKLDEKLDETSFDTDKNMFTNNFVELNGEKYYFNAKGPKDTRFLFAKKTKSGYDFNVDLSANELQTLKQKLVAISLDQTFLKKRLDNIWNSRLNSVSLQENNKTAPKPVKKVESIKKEDMKVNDIDFDKMTDAEAMKAFMKLSNAFNSKFKTTISNINLELRNNKNIKESLKKLVLFLEENKIEREEIEIKCK